MGVMRISLQHLLQGSLVLGLLLGAQAWVDTGAIFTEPTPAVLSLREAPAYPPGTVPPASGQTSSNSTTRQTTTTYPPTTAASSAATESATSILSRLLQANEINPELVDGIGIVNEASLNAYTDGQAIYIHKPLWDLLPNNDERAFVIGHELAHVSLRHIEKTAVRRTGFSLLDNVLGRAINNPLVDTVASLGLVLIDKKFSRNVEYQADELGLELMTRAGYRPQAAVTTLQRMQAHGGGAGVEFLQDHPLSESRVRALVGQIQAEGVRS